MVKFLKPIVEILDKEKATFIPCVKFPKVIEQIRSYNNYLVRFLFRFPSAYCYYEQGFWEWCCEIMDKRSNEEIPKHGEVIFKDIFFSYDFLTDITTNQKIFILVSNIVKDSSKFKNLSKKDLEDIELDYGREYLLKARDRCICNGMKEDHYD